MFSLADYRYGCELCIGALPADDIDKRWLAAVAAHGKQYDDMSSSWRRAVVPGGEAWVDAARRTFDQAKELYADGFAHNDDKKRLKAIEQLEKLSGAIEKYGSQTLTKGGEIDWPKIGMPAWLKVALIGGGVLVGTGLLAFVFMPVVVALVQRGGRR